MTRDNLASLLRLVVLAVLITAWTAPYTADAARRRWRNNPTADWLVQIAKEYYHQGQYVDALHEFKKALLIQPTHLEALLYVDILEVLTAPAGTPSYPPEPLIRAKEPIGAPQESRILPPAWPPAQEPVTRAAPGLVVRPSYEEPAAPAAPVAPLRVSEADAETARREIETSRRAKELIRQAIIDAELRKAKAEKAKLRIAEPEPEAEARVDTTMRDAEIDEALWSAEARLEPEPSDSGRRAVGTMDVTATIPSSDESVQEEAPADQGEMDDAIKDALSRLRGSALAKTGLADEAEQSLIPPVSGTSPAGEEPDTVFVEGGAGGIQVVVNGEPLRLERPVRVEQGRLLVPLRDLANALGASVVSLGNGEVQLIMPDGQTISFRLSSTDPGLLVTEEEMREHLHLRTRYDPTQRALFLETDSQPGFRTYSVPKTEEQLQLEAAQRPVIQSVPQGERPVTAPGDVPDSAKPTVEITGVASYSHEYINEEEPFRSLSVTGRGRITDFDLAFESIRKDILGDFSHDYTYINFRRPDLFVGLVDQWSDLFPLRSQFEEFRGVKVKKVWVTGPVPPRLVERHPFRPLELRSNERLATTVSFGTTESQTSGTGGFTKYLGRLTEVRQTVVPTDWLRVQGGIFYLENEADVPERAGTTSMPRNNLVSFGDLRVILPNEWALSGQLAQAHYEPDNNPDGTVDDWNWRTALDIDRERYRMRLAYEYVGDEYASLDDPAIYRDYRGATWFGTYRFSDKWSMSGSFLRYRNNVDRDPDNTTSENQAVSVSTTHRMAGDQSLTVSAGHTIANPSGPNAGSSSRGISYGFDYFRPFLFDSRLLTSYQYFQTEAPASSDSSSHSLGLTLFGSLGFGSSWDLSERLRSTDHEFEEDERSLDTSFNVDYQLTKTMSSYLNTTYSRQLHDDAESQDTLSSAIGLDYELVPGTRIGTAYKVTSYNLDTERGQWPHDWSVLVVLSKDFGFATPPAFGRIEGFVFQDANGNGMPDPGELWVEDAIARLGEADAVSTDAGGRFVFSRLAPGPAEVTLDLSNIDSAWMVKDPHRSAIISRNRTSWLYYPMVEAAALRGAVFIDNNEDGVFQPQEEPLQDVAVVLAPGDEFRRTTADGEYEFVTLLPGDYLVSVYEQDLPKGYELMSKEPRALTLEAGEEKSGVDFAVRLIPEPEPAPEP